MIENKVEVLDEVTKLLNDIRSAWTTIPAEARKK
jgi:flagellin-specific chaperone FliS